MTRAGTARDRRAVMQDEPRNDAADNESTADHVARGTSRDAWPTVDGSGTVRGRTDDNDRPRRITPRSGRDRGRASVRGDPASIRLRAAGSRTGTGARRST